MPILRLSWTDPGSRPRDLDTGHIRMFSFFSLCHIFLLVCLHIPTEWPSLLLQYIHGPTMGPGPPSSDTRILLQEVSIVGIKIPQLRLLVGTQERSARLGARTTSSSIFDDEADEVCDVREDREADEADADAVARYVLRRIL